MFIFHYSTLFVLCIIKRENYIPKTSTEPTFPFCSKRKRTNKKNKS